MPRTVNDVILSDTTVGVGTITSDAQQLDNLYGFAIQAQWTGTVTGTLIVQTSNDGINWNDISATSTDLNAVSSVMLNEKDTFYNNVRVKVTVATGSLTTIDAVFNGKGI